MRDDGTYGKPLARMEVLTLATIAWTGSTISTAALLGRSRNTVRGHIIRARAKLGATTTTNAIWLAWAQIRPLYDEIESSAGSSLAARAGRATADSTVASGR